MYSDRHQTPFDDALAKVGQLTALEFIDAIDINAEQEDAEPDPPVADES